MSRYTSSVLAIALALAAGAARAVPPPATAEPPTPAGAVPPLPVAAMPPPAPGAAAPVVAQGQVQRLLINPYGEVDGLRLADGTVVRFPPHLSQALSAAIKPGDAVRVIGRPQSRGSVKADAIVNATSGQTVYDQPPPPDAGRPLPPHLRAQALRPQRVEGQVDAVLTGPRGEANGVILTDGSIVRFPPESLRLSVLPGAPFAADGLGTRNALGTSLEAISMGTSLSALQPLYDRTP
ncbi:hypothetical protein [Achromobacter ruhlandii]|uniref:hypothetical protein n=1 Tax=Achromobacter ruhlandii TaxID=72557 RepID=UPI001EED235C|nr:hypothetical protein [Achromobacter ruhlandii]MCZ8396382.1 hypothetical protein [Achromobacter ruhlandii]